MNAILETMAGNTQNQDRGAIINCGKNLVLVIADGVGGLSGGAEAATMAVDFVRQNGAALNTPDSCVNLLRNLDHVISRDKVAGQTTCVLTVVSEGRVDGASIGDSGAWVIGENSMVDLTKGQMHRPFAGSGNAGPVSFSHKIASGEHLLLATDGLFKYASPEQIAAICRLHSPATASRKLIELVRYPSGALPDDTTIIIL